MNTPLCDFVKKYKDSDFLRLHMPGHKGKNLLGFEAFDITEISGADSLYKPCGIIRESEKNASELFGADTFYSAEGSSLSIRAMLYLAFAYAQKCGRKPIIAAGRNAHRVFVSSSAVMGFDVEWIYGEGFDGYLSCTIDPLSLDEFLSQREVCAVYITSPDYLGNISDIKGIAEVCKKHGCLCLVDNAHGAYLRFLEPSQHPIDLGADICCDSAHKTFPVLTGGAYLHISKSLPEFFAENAKEAMALFGSTSPSYLIMQSLDAVNAYLADGYRGKLQAFSEKILKLKSHLSDKGFCFAGDEPLKLTVASKTYGYRGFELADELRHKSIECEFCDPDFVVLMLTPEISDEELLRIEKAFCDIERKASIDEKMPGFSVAEKVMSHNEAVFSEKEELPVSRCIGRVLADISVSCPPAVPVLMCGERIGLGTVKCFEYYGIDKICVVKKEL